MLWSIFEIKDNLIVLKTLIIILDITFKIIAYRDMKDSPTNNYIILSRSNVNVNYSQII